MSASGIVDDPTSNARIIPESRRADGSIRKERKVKPGFTPTEDIARFRPSRVLRAQEEAAKRGTSIPGYEPPTVLEARKAMEKATVSDPAPANITAPSRSDSADWRRATNSRLRGSPGKSSIITTPSPERSSAGKTQAAFSGASSDNWRIRAEKKKEIPDDWDEEEEKKAEKTAATGADKEEVDSKDSVPVKAQTSSTGGKVKQEKRGINSDAIDEMTKGVESLGVKEK